MAPFVPSLHCPTDFPLIRRSEGCLIAPRRSPVRAQLAPLALPGGRLDRERLGARRHGPALLPLDRRRLRPSVLASSRGGVQPGMSSSLCPRVIHVDLSLLA